MPVAALVLYGAWFVLAFGWRSYVQWRRTGDTGFRGLHARPGSLEWMAGAGFTLALFIGVAAPVAALIGLDAPDALDNDVLTAAGTGLAALGVALTFAAQLSMGDSWRIGVDESERTTLVTAGAFQLVRNPIFSAMVLTAIGLTCMVPNVLALVGFAALLIALELQVRGVEEPYLRTVHGATYDDYVARVGRFVPGLGRR